MHAFCVALLLALMQAPAAAAQRTDFGSITCPVVGTFVKNGLLVPNEDGLITREQTLQAFLDHNVDPKIAVTTTDGNFKSDDCPNCPVFIDPFEMNTIADGQKIDSPVDAPQEHFRSTGIRDRAGGPHESLYNLAERICLPENASAWTFDDVLCFTDVWDRDGRCGISSNDVSEDKRPERCGPCDSFKTKPDSCRSALIDTILFMFSAFRNRETGTFDKHEFKAMWIDLEFPTGFEVNPPQVGAVLISDDFEVGVLDDDVWQVSADHAAVVNRGRLSEFSLRLSKDGSATVGPFLLKRGLKVTFVSRSTKQVNDLEGLTVTVSGADMPQSAPIGRRWKTSEMIFETPNVGSTTFSSVTFAMNGANNKHKVFIDDVIVEELV